MDQKKNLHWDHKQMFLGSTYSSICARNKLHDCTKQMLKNKKCIIAYFVVQANNLSICFQMDIIYGLDTSFMIQTI